MSTTVQFRWKDYENNTRIVGQFETDWVFKKGELFNFWGGLNEVVDVRVDFELDQNKLEAIQIVTVIPYWTQNELNLTPELLWKDSQIIDK
jgi:hypothetical protein